MSSLRRTQIFLLVIVSIPVLYCGFLLGLLIYFLSVPERFEAKLKIYPNARQFTYTSNLYGAGSFHKAPYYWTPDNIGDVIKYYETFSLPLMQDKWEEDALISAYSPKGRSLDYNDPITGEFIDFEASSRRCDYSQRYKCVNIYLYDLGMGGHENIPDVSQRPTASYTPPDFTLLNESTGTVIILSYYVFSP